MNAKSFKILYSRSSAWNLGLPEHDLFDLICRTYNYSSAVSNFPDLCSRYQDKLPRYYTSHSSEAFAKLYCKAKGYAKDEVEDWEKYFSKRERDCYLSDSDSDSDSGVESPKLEAIIEKAECCDDATL